MNVNRRNRVNGWKSLDDVRLICHCQAHARREKALWRRSLRAVGRIRTRGLAVLLGIPLALGAIDLPTEAMNTSALPIKTFLRQAARQPEADLATSLANTLPIFTTEQVREHFLAPETATDLFSLDGIEEHFFRTQVPYGSIIYREAKRHKLPPALVAAVVESESDFRPRLISNKNAQGLMQLIPSTGRLMGAGDLFNPSENIAAGTKYLRYLFDRFGDQRIALAAYNAGEGNVERFGGVPPFPETINYLRRVNTRTHLYRQRVRGTYAASLRMRNSLYPR